MRLRPLILTVPLVLALSACGGDDEVTVNSPTSAPAAAPSLTVATPSSTAAVGVTTNLTGTLGTADDPEAYEIGLTDASGAPVSTLPAGTYQLTVDDQSVTHNFHLTGAGVDEMTGISAKEKKVFTVTLTAGTYDFVCDPHTDSMSGSFTVT